MSVFLFLLPFGLPGDLLGSSAALLLNAMKELAGIDHDIRLIPEKFIEPIQRTKITYLHGQNPRLHTDEVLVALWTGKHLRN